MDRFPPVDMGPEALKAKYGPVVFWGGGTDTQKVLPFGTPEEAREMVRPADGHLRGWGCFVFNTVHNVQAGIPTQNLLGGLRGGQ